MASLVLTASLWSVLYVIIEAIVVFGGAMFFTWLVVFCIRSVFGYQRHDIKRPHKMEKSRGVAELRYEIESTRLQTEKLRLEQQRMRSEEQSKKGE